MIPCDPVLAVAITHLPNIAFGQCRPGALYKAEQHLIVSLAPRFEGYACFDLCEECLRSVAHCHFPAHKGLGRFEAPLKLPNFVWQSLLGYREDRRIEALPN